MAEATLHIAMYPWLALGHLTPFLHLANKLAKKGHRISFFTPIKTQHKLEHFNLHPDLITFVPISVPHLDGLPPGTETTSDVTYHLFPLLMTAMDHTEGDIELLFQDLKPDVVLFDISHWMPRLARRLGIKSIRYDSSSSVMTSYGLSPARFMENKYSEADLMQPPRGFPSSSIKLSIYEARFFAMGDAMEFGSRMRFVDRHYICLSECDALGFKTCREIEGPFIDYLQSQFGKPVLLSGPIIPEPTTSTLDEKWEKWLGGFKPNSMIYCALGSECNLQTDQFQELVLGLELTGMPFLAALKPPPGLESVESALPEGFEERIKGRGVVYGGWVQQPLILEHPSIGCFITHCGSGSLSEALINKCQMVMLPQIGDQIINARMMGVVLKVGVEVDKGEEDGFFTKESVCKAVRAVMDEDSEIAIVNRANHAKLRELLLSKDFESSYINDFIEKLLALLK
ncbi:UGTPg34 [Tripterygium wilfordii]|uniref:Glycosyltransferase n=1 Tax=Tripterygium wilfordii TaxID=458696 RepID=A0A7J7CEM5_TRIWF|nr:cyanidin 3-O-galactoside 2''-O-xylosyltransferase FGGT1-like [Tripterygium wilfordii]KAF5732589.1 UGTPg34 [Tripterygium wilfordii]